VTDELLTRRERERIERIRKEKWAKIQQVLPLMVKHIAELKKPFLYKYEEVGRHDVIRKRQRIEDGPGARITFCKIGEEVIIGQEDYRYPR
jgi:hypothetical protein